MACVNIDNDKNIFKFKELGRIFKKKQISRESGEARIMYFFLYFMKINTQHRTLYICSLGIMLFQDMTL